MQRRFFVCLLACLTACGASAVEPISIPVLKVGTAYYTNVLVTSSTATDIFFSHSRGMGNAKLKYLDPEVQKRFNFNAGKAQELEKKHADANIAFRKDIVSKPNPTRPNTPAPTPYQGPVEPGDIIVKDISATSFRGRPAPRFVVEKWLTAKPDMIGKFVLIDFWATWCPPCRKSIPDLNKLHAKFSDKMIIIGLSDEEENEVRAMTSPKMDYFVVIDRSWNMKHAVCVRGIPHALILDPNWVVRYEGHPGYLNEKNVAGLLAKYSP